MPRKIPRTPNERREFREFAANRKRVIVNEKNNMLREKFPDKSVKMYEDVLVAALKPNEDINSKRAGSARRILENYLDELPEIKQILERAIVSQKKAGRSPAKIGRELAKLNQIQIRLTGLIRKFEQKKRAQYN